VPLDALDSSYLNVRSAAGWLPAMLNVVLLATFLWRFEEVDTMTTVMVAPSAVHNHGAAASRTSCLSLRQPMLEPPVATSSHVPTVAPLPAVAHVQDHPIGRDPRIDGESSEQPVDSQLSLRLRGEVAHEALLEVSEAGATYAEVICRRGGWFLLLCGFGNGFQLTALDTIVTPIVQAEYGWGTLENSALFGGLALVALLTMAMTSLLTCCCAAHCISPDGMPRYAS